MPTVLTHPAVPIALAVGLGSDVIPRKLLVAGIVASVLPDLDVLAFRLGIPYGADFGHRGFSHSVMAALIVAVIGAFFFRRTGRTPLVPFLFLFVAMVSHGVLDAFTNGGLGIAFLWPWSDERFFAPVRVIDVASIGVSRFLSHRGLVVMRSEIVWVWLPLLGSAAVAATFRWWFDRRRGAGDAKSGAEYI